jgi:hypothetical protein
MEATELSIPPLIATSIFPCLLNSPNVLKITTKIGYFLLLSGAADCKKEVILSGEKKASM